MEKYMSAGVHKLLIVLAIFIIYYPYKKTWIPPVFNELDELISNKKI